MPAIRVALLTIRLAMRTKAALFFTFLFPLIFLFVYAVLIARGNPAVIAYMFGPVVTLNIMGSGFWGLGMQSVMQRERGSLRRYRLAPIGPGTIIMGNLLANYLLELPTVGLLLITAVGVFHMPMPMSLLTFLLLVTVGTFAFAGFGLTISSIANTMQEAQIFNNMVWFALLFLSGVTFPLPMLPKWIQQTAMFFPSTYLVSTFQSIAIQSDPLLKHGLELAILLICGTFGLLLALRLFRWEKEERISNRSKLWACVCVLPLVIMGTWMNLRANPMAYWSRSYSLMTQASDTAEKRPNPNTIDDFDAEHESTAPFSQWEISTSAEGANPSAAEAALLVPGAEGTAHALRIEGRAPSPQAAEGCTILARRELRIPAQPANLHGVELQVRGTSRMCQIRLVPPKGNAAPSASFVPGAEWQNIKVPIAWLADPLKNMLADGPWTIEVSESCEHFTLDLDEIRFY
jgi:ABC-2 type transport system permease protein